MRQSGRCAAAANVAYEKGSSGTGAPAREIAALIYPAILITADARPRSGSSCFRSSCPRSLKFYATFDQAAAGV
jgi:hypothetical protein